MNKEFWTDYYKKEKIKEPSSFAEFCVDKIDGDLVDVGCGDGRDLYFFKKEGIQAHGVDGSNEDIGIIKQNILSYIRANKSPENVYARFFWHAITREEQLEILRWTKNRIFIEARTKKDKPKNIIGRHKRNMVDVNRLVKDLKDNGFEILHLEDGYGFSPFRGEDPHLVRVIAEKST